MTKLRNLFALFLLLGLIFAEVLPNIRNYQPAPARSADTDILSALLSSSVSPDELAAAGPAGFLDINIPANPAEVSRDTQGLLGLAYRPAITTPTSPNYFLSESTATGYQPSALDGILPPEASDLYYAYQDGGRAWYQKGNHVLVIFPDESIRSFNAKTGESTIWLQDRLAYAPIQDANAIQNFQTNYHAEVVAETTTWVLMEFPSGGVIKVARSLVANSPVGGSASPTYTLPAILPGYEN